MSEKGLFEIGGLLTVGGVILAAIVGDATGWVRCEQHHLGTQMEMQAVASAVRDFEAERGALPVSLTEVADRFDAGVPPDDYFGRPFQYVRPGPDGEDFSLMSLGRDGVEGGIGEDADVWFEPCD